VYTCGTLPRSAFLHTKRTQRSFDQHTSKHKISLYIQPQTSLKAPLSPLPSHLSLQRQHTRPIRQLPIIPTRAGRPTLIQQLQIARVDSKRLVRIIPPQIAVGDIIRPGRAAIGFPSKRILLGRSLRGPAAAETGRSERAEVAPVGPDGFDDHEVFLLALEGVDLHGFEEVVCAVRHHGYVVGSKAAREVADGHAGAVDFAVVAAEKQVHVLAVGDERLVDRPCAGARDAAREQRLRGRPRVALAGVLGRLVREGGWAPLVRENPDGLGCEVEECRGDGARDAVLCGRSHVGPVAEGREHHGAPVVAVVVVGRVHQLLAVVVHGREVLERRPAGFGLSERPS
jgi:hypothetical protein